MNWFPQLRPIRSLMTGGGGQTFHSIDLEIGFRSDLIETLPSQCQQSYTAVCQRIETTRERERERREKRSSLRDYPWSGICWGWQAWERRSEVHHWPQRQAPRLQRWQRRVWEVGVPHPPPLPTSLLPQSQSASSSGPGSPSLRAAKERRMNGVGECETWWG